MTESLSIQDLNSLIDYYKKNLIDPTHLELQKEYLLKSKKAGAEKEKEKEKKTKEHKSTRGIVNI